jgi:hypothetical protein
VGLKVGFSKVNTKLVISLDTGFTNVTYYQTRSLAGGGKSMVFVEWMLRAEKASSLISLVAMEANKLVAAEADRLSAVESYIVGSKINLSK